MIAGRRTRRVPPPSIPSCTSYPPPTSDPPRSPPARSPVATLQSRRHLPSEKRRCLCLPLWTNFPPEPNPSLPTGHAPPHAGLSLLRFYRFEFFGAPAPRPSCPFCDCACVHGAGTLQAVSPPGLVASADRRAAPRTRRGLPVPALLRCADAPAPALASAFRWLCRRRDLPHTKAPNLTRRPATRYVHPARLTCAYSVCSDRPGERRRFVCSVGLAAFVDTA